MHQDDELEPATASWAATDANDSAGVSPPSATEWRAGAFGRAMKKARDDLGWSQRKLAAALGTLNLRIDPSAITRIEKGQREVKFSEAAVIAAVLEFSLDGVDFLDDADSSTRFTQSEIRIRASMREARGAILGALRAADAAVASLSAGEDVDLGVLAERGAGTFSEWIETVAEGMERSFRFPDPKYGEGRHVFGTQADLKAGERLVSAITNDLFVDEAEIDADHENDRRARQRYWLEQARIALTEACGTDVANSRLGDLDAGETK